MCVYIRTCPHVCGVPAVGPEPLKIGACPKEKVGGGEGWEEGLGLSFGGTRFAVLLFGGLLYLKFIRAED